MGDDPGIKFLENDFNQCFQQMRHYDNQLWDIAKFTFTGYAALFGLSIGLYRYGIDKRLDFTLAIAALLGVGFLGGLFLYALAIRHRVYYVAVTRYINEHRCFFLSKQPLGFVNATQMYTDYAKPDYYHWRSSQIWLINIIALFNSLAISAIFYCFFIDYNSIQVISILEFVIAFSVQVLISYIYLSSRPSDNIGISVFGKKKSP